MEDMTQHAQYYEESLYPLQNKILRAVNGLSSPFYLTGGTALSRGYFNHRYSDDLDFFASQRPAVRGCRHEGESPNV